MVFSVGFAGMPRDCDEHSAPSGRFLSCGYWAAMAQGAAMCLKAAFSANGLRVNDRLMAVIFGLKLE